MTDETLIREHLDDALRYIEIVVHTCKEITIRKLDNGGYLIRAKDIKTI